MNRQLIKNISIFFISLVAALMVNPLYAQPLEMLTSERKQVEQDMKHIDNLLKSIEGNQKAGLQKLTLIKTKINTRKKVLSNIDKQIDYLNKELDRKQEAINILQAELEGTQTSYSNLLRYYYSIRSKDDWLMYIMASESVSQAYKRMRYFREILLLLQAQADNIIRQTNKLNEEIADMARKQQLLQDNISDKSKEINILESEEKESQTVLSDLKRKENDLRKQFEEKKKSYNRLNENLKEFFRSEEGRTIEVSPTDMKLITDRFEALKGILSWPAMGTITSKFGKHHHAVYTNITFENTGIDIQVPQSADVYSIFDGIVTKISKMPKTGETTIVIRHGMYSSIYFQVENVAVKVGETVKARQKIATVAASGEGYILHFEIRKDNKSGQQPIPQNPESWIIK